MTKRTSILAIVAVVTTAGFLVPAQAAFAGYDRDFGAGSCGGASAFIESNSRGYVAHYANRVRLGAWEDGVFNRTHQSGMASSWSSASVTGQDGGTAPAAVLNWARTGCGGL